jgi:hypothetical protein
MTSGPSRTRTPLAVTHLLSERVRVAYLHGVGACSPSPYNEKQQRDIRNRGNKPRRQPDTVVRERERQEDKSEVDEITGDAGAAGGGARRRGGGRGAPALWLPRGAAPVRAPRVRRRRLPAGGRPPRPPLRARLPPLPRPPPPPPPPQRECTRSRAVRTRIVDHHISRSVRFCFKELRRPCRWRRRRSTSSSSSERRRGAPGSRRAP